MDMRCVIPQPGIQPLRSRANRRGFTMLELMAAIFIFSLVLTAIYATWRSIVKGSTLGLSVAAQVQRSRVAMRALEDAFLTTQMYAENMKHYYFIADASGDYSAVSMVSRLPASFPGVGRYGDQVVRRVNFYTQPGTNGADLVMSQAPVLLATNEAGVEPYSLVLARDVSLFMLEYWDQQKQEWATEWFQTNQMPKLVKITLGQGRSSGSMSDPQDIVTRIVAIPAVIVSGMQGIQGGPLPPPQGIPPGGIPPGGIPPGVQPGQQFPGQPGGGRLPGGGIGGGSRFGGGR